MILKEWILSGLVYGYALMRGHAKTNMPAPRRVLVWQMAKLGDMVCTTPMFRALKLAYPEVQITVVGNALNKQLLEGSPDVDDYLIFNGFFTTLRQIRRGNYDAACVTAPSTIAIAVLFLGDVRCISAPRITNGSSPYETTAYRTLLQLVAEHPHRMRHYAPREYLNLLESVGVHTDDTRKHLKFSDSARTEIESFLHERGLSQKKFVAISPSAGNKIKQWPVDRFARVSQHIASMGFPVVVIGGSRDRKEVTEMMLHLEGSSGIINALEKFSIDELKAFLAQAALLVAVDTGPIYIAEAFGVPTVDITGPIDEQEQPPIGPSHIVVTPPPPRVPELFVMDARRYNEKEARRQADSITVDMVLSACEKVLNQYAPHP